MPTENRNPLDVDQDWLVSALGKGIPWDECADRWRIADALAECVERIEDAASNLCTGAAGPLIRTNKPGHVPALEQDLTDWYQRMMSLVEEARRYEPSLGPPAP